MALDYTGSYLVSGSMDTTCMVWQVVQDFGSSVTLEPSPVHILYGHDDGVISVDVSIELDMVVSASVDGSVNIHTLKKGYFVKTLSFRNENFFSRFCTINVKISNQRHILIYTHALAKPSQFISNKVC